MIAVDEEWKPIPGFDGYEISNQLRIRSFRTFGIGESHRATPMILKCRSRGYQYQLRTNGRYRTVSVRSIAAEVFGIPCSDGRVKAARLAAAKARADAEIASWPTDPDDRPDPTDQAT